MSVVFKKRTNKGGAGLKRRKASGSSSDDDDTVVVKKLDTRPASTSNPLVQQTVHFSKTSSASGSSSSSPSVRVTYQSSRSGVVSGPDDQGATAIVEVDTERDRDARSVLERSLKAQETGDASSDQYTGKKNYTMFTKPQDTPAGSAASMHGPVRAPAFLRATTRWDYAPDICKDYKETGFCGFGDSCKFLHDRSDYKFGWQLENEYVAQHKHGAPPLDNDPHKYEVGNTSDDEDVDGLPFKCFICRESFKNPVVTKCRHYFCESCAIAQCKKSMRCLACGTDTKGVFLPAKELAAKLAKMEEASNEKPAEKVSTEDDSD